MSLLPTLKEQETFGFTGRINVLDKPSGQFLGVIFQEEGVIINALYRQVRGKKALYQLAMEDLRGEENLRYVVEPEVIEEADRRFELAVKAFQGQAREMFEKAENAQRLRPPDKLRLTINPEFVVKGEEISSEEFEILLNLTDYHRVGELYEHSSLLDFEVTNGLVSLRQKGALKVLGD